MTHKEAHELFRHRMSPSRGGNGSDGPKSLVVERGTKDLLDEIGDEGLSEDTLEFRNVCRRAAGLTYQLLAGGESHWTEARVVDLRELVASLDLGAFFTGNVVFCTDFTTSPCRVWANPGHLEEMTMVLVLNAREAVGSRGTVRLAVEHLSGMNIEGEIRDGWVQLEVADSGVGTDPGALARILQLRSTTRSPGEDRRIGLSVACGTVRQNRGGMNITSEPGRGTVVRVWFPSVQENAAPRPFWT